MNCCIFDLDGVIVDTAKYHYRAWCEMAQSLGFEFTPEQAEATKGVSRMASLEIILNIGGLGESISTEQKEKMAAAKNARYLELVEGMTPDELLPGVLDFIEELRTSGVKVVLGSASKNAGIILDRCNIRELFDAIVDGNLVSKAKPDPEVFSLGAKLVGQSPEDCVVFEDAQAGIEAANRAGMRSVGVGDALSLREATINIESFEGFSMKELVARLK